MFAKYVSTLNARLCATLCVQNTSPKLLLYCLRVSPHFKLTVDTTEEQNTNYVCFSARAAFLVLFYSLRPPQS